ncbi:hypothetical protein [Methylocystis sp.]|uniref:hypothetical protein n=1 Tax=Methylocystis sp. TaxID=1911079 RepID=UPI003D11D99E
MTNDIENFSKDLHWPGRADCLEDIEQHLNTASRLARALWIALTVGDFAGDERDVDALCELASAVSDHTSAARFAFYGKLEKAEARS